MISLRSERRNTLSLEESSTLPQHSTPSETEKIKELRYRQRIINEMDVDSQSILIRLFIDSKLTARHGVFVVVAGFVPTSRPSSRHFIRDCSTCFFL
jgi:hypothetical protein